MILELSNSESPPAGLGDYQFIHSDWAQGID
jgi:hypothetical protein